MATHLKYLFSILILCLGSFLHSPAQKQEKSAYVVTRAGDTLRGINVNYFWMIGRMGVLTLEKQDGEKVKLNFDQVQLYREFRTNGRVVTCHSIQENPDNPNSYQIWEEVYRGEITMLLETNEAHPDTYMMSDFFTGFITRKTFKQDILPVVIKCEAVYKELEDRSLLKFRNHIQLLWYYNENCGSSE